LLRGGGWGAGGRGPETAPRGGAAARPARTGAPRTAARSGADRGPCSRRARPAPSGVRPPHPWRQAPPRASRRESRPREPPSAPTAASPGMQLAVSQATKVPAHGGRWYDLSRPIRRRGVERLAADSAVRVVADDPDLAGGSGSGSDSGVGLRAGDGSAPARRGGGKRR